jgi:cell division protein FtsL
MRDVRQQQDYCFRISRTTDIKAGVSMTNNEKLLIISLIGAGISFIVMAITSYKEAYDRGHRDGWHKGRAVNRSEFWSE